METTRWREGVLDVKTVVDVVREPMVVLDKDLRVIVANGSFYRFFSTNKKNTEKVMVYELGSGQWNIPALRELLRKVISDDTFFKGFKVECNFPSLGHKIILVSGRRIYKENSSLELALPRILFVMEDITDMMIIAENLADKMKKNMGHPVT